ncbi:MAG: hypothetical protein Q4E42_02510 [Phascolarctobacterium sp.]|nr:hypothetical protein [Phascolarctobacterium sp.]
MSVMYEWVCENCGKKVLRGETLGRPQPGVCPRALFKGRPHRWTKNRTFGKK